MPDQPIVYALKCPSCGASLSVNKGTETLACAHCGSTSAVHIGGGAVSSDLVEAVLRGIRSGTDKTAAELAIKRLEAELIELDEEVAESHRYRDEVIAWFAKRENEATNAGSVGLIFVFCIIVGFVVGGIASNVSSDFGFFVGMAAGIAIFIPLLNQDGQRTRAKWIPIRAERDAKLEEVNSSIQKLEKKVADRRDRLQSNREIVEA